jgi:diaminohydroxyphosphoribosylaminopyrimidine deaminase/5-amino-6-(5-phosphoribosylamino)uracil reductase
MALHGSLPPAEAGFTPGDIARLERCFALAHLGQYTSRPNPAVGCVLVKDGHIVGEGFTQPPGQPHAEIMALRQAGAAARGATVYVSFEPCAHHGRTGPCSDALIAAGVARVVYAMEDPNPLVCGRGLARLREAGIEVAGPLCEDTARALNPGFIKRMTQGLPYVRCKIGMSLDGRTAMASGESQWITGSEARADVQQWRARSCAIVTGIGTVLADDPALNVRLPEFTGPPPLRVVADSHGRLPPTARLLTVPGAVLQAGLASAVQAPRTTAAHWEYRQLPPALNSIVSNSAAFNSIAPNSTASNSSIDSGIDLCALLHLLAQDYACNEVLVEAGPRLCGALLHAGLVDELLIYMAPTLLGHEARPLAWLPGLQTLAQALPLSFADVIMLGKDCRIRAFVANRPV